MNDFSRFLNKIEFTESCWLWTAGLNEKGYGLFTLGKTRKAHIISYEWFIGIVSDVLELDHLCRIRRCVNPEHLEAVTHAENMRRGTTGNRGLRERNKTHCPQSHEYTEENTYKRRGQRECRICIRVRNKEFQRLKRLDREI